MPRRQEALCWRLTAPSLLHAYIPKPNLRLEFPPKALPMGSAGIVHFMVHGTEQSWERWRQRGCVDTVFRSQLKAPISNPPIKLITPAPLPWTVERLLLLNQIPCMSQQKQRWLLTGESAGRLHLQQGSEEGLALSPGSVCTIPKPSGHNGRGVNQIIIASTKSYIFRS